MKYETIVVNKIDATLLEEWKNLWEISEYAHICNSPEWFQLYCCLHEENSYRLILIRQAKKLVGLVPLIIERKAGIPTFQFPGGKYLDRCPILLLTKEHMLLKTLVTNIKSQGNIYLHELPEDLANEFKGIDPSLFIKESSISPYLTLDDNPLRYMPSDDKNKLVNRITKNQNHITFKRFFGDAVILKTAVAIDKRSTKMKKGIATFRNDDEIKFYEELLRVFKEKFVVDILYFDNIPFAYSIGLQYKSIFHGISTAYDDNYKYLQPGKAMVYYILQSLQNEKVKTFDFSRGDTAFKRTFTPHANRQYDVFYTNSIAVNYLWKVLDTFRIRIINNKKLYGVYCKIRKQFYR